MKHVTFHVDGKPVQSRPYSSLCLRYYVDKFYVWCLMRFVLKT